MNQKKESVNSTKQKSDSLTGFITYPTYTTKNNKAYIILYSKLENGESAIIINEAKPYFYIKQKDSKNAHEIIKNISGDIESTLENIKIENTNFLNFKKEKLSKVSLEIPKDVPIIRSNFEKSNIVCYEADIKFAYRYMIDKDIQSMFKISGDYIKANKIEPDEINNLNEEKIGIKSPFYDDDKIIYYVDRMYFNKNIENINEDELKTKKPKLKVISFDIETDQNADKIYSISTYFVDYLTNKKYSENLVISDYKVKNALSFKSEKELLQKFKKSILEFDPDIITGWNVIDFDLMVLQKSFRKNNINFDLGRNSNNARLNIQQNFMTDSKANLYGRMTLDGIHLLKLSHIGLSDYKLDTAASEIIGDRKLITDVTNKGAEIDNLFQNEKDKLVAYNEKDAILVIKILEAKDIINLTITRSLLTGMPLDRVQASVATLDSLYIREAKKRKIICNSGQYSDKDSGILGGFVMNPKTGIHENIIVLDFKSLYPSIMITFNIDPMTNSSDGTIVAPNGTKFENTKDAILPSLIDKIWKERDNAKKRNDQIASYALKVIINSFFGVLANSRCRFFSMDMANAITHFGQYIIKTTAKELQKEGYETLYSDTDSVFVKTGAKSIDEAKKIGEEITIKINNYFKEKIKSEYKRDSRLELEFEKIFRKIIFPKTRGDSNKGAKKRYAGLLIKDNTEKMDFTGLEFVRRDWTEVSKKFQLTLLDKIFHEEEIKDYVKEFVNDIKNKKYDNLLIYTKAIRKDLSSYTKTTPPHVKAARKLDKIESTIIKYIITTDGPEPIQKIEHDIDYEHYIEKQIKPIADSVLCFFDTNFDDLIKGSTQKSLFNF
jgi:DNA polymerase-2